MVRFIHAADIHLDSPMQRLELYEGAPLDEIRLSTRRAFTNLIELAISRQVDFVLIAGDLYDGDWRDHNTGLFFAHEVSRLQTAGIALYLINGNHDAENKLTKALPLPLNPDATTMQLSTESVQTVQLEALGVMLHGQGFHRQAETENLSESYPNALAGYINIGMLHTSLQGAPGHAPYAPCTPQQLADKEYDYWALGHIHMRSDRAIPGSCPIVFSGNTQGRNVRELGAKGCMVVEIDASHRATSEFVALDVCRWHICNVDATELEHMDDFVSTVTDDLRRIALENTEHTSIVRVLVQGDSPLHDRLLARQQHWQNVLRQATFELDDDEIWMERLKVNHPETYTGQHDNVTSHIGDWIGAIDEVAGTPETLDAVSTALRPLLDKLPDELLQGEENLDWTQVECLQDLVHQSRPVLLERLGGMGDGDSEVDA